MTPYEQAVKLYEGDDECTLMDDLAFHLVHGYVVNTPTLFMLARPVVRASAPYGPKDFFAWDACDAWLVWCMAGDIREAMRFAPDCPRIKWVAFARRGVIRFHPFQKIRTAILHRGWISPLKVVPHDPKQVLQRLA